MGYNSTIITKKKMLRCGHFGYNFSNGNCKDCANLISYRKRLDKIANSESEDSFPDLIDMLDAVFSKFIRLSAADKDGFANCFICDSRHRWQDMDNAHFVSRGNKFLRYDTRNCKACCRTCNQYLDGNITLYAKRLNEANIGVTEVLLEESHLVYKFSRHELENLIDEYRTKVNNLLKNIKQ
jgi:hypothetical protein